MPDGYCTIILFSSFHAEHGELIEIVVLIDSSGARESLLLDKHAFMVVLQVAAQPKLQHKFNSNKLP